MDLLSMAEDVLNFLVSIGPWGATILAGNVLFWAWMLYSGRIVSRGRHEDLKGRLEDLKDECRRAWESSANWKKLFMGAITTAERSLPEMPDD